MIIKKEFAQKLIDNWNARIDRFMSDELTVLLQLEGVEVKNGMVPMTAWFTAQKIIGRMNFYETGRELQKKLRNSGHDVLMDMQSNKLMFRE